MKNNCKKASYCDDNFTVTQPKLMVKNDDGQWTNMEAGKVTFGSTKLPQAKWTVKVTNKNGEEAHQAGFTAYFPPLIKLNSHNIVIRKTDNEQMQKIKEYFFCKEQITVSYNKISCHVGNPYGSNIVSDITLLLDIIYVRDSQRPTLEGRIDTWTHKTYHKLEDQTNKNGELARQTRGPEIWGSESANTKSYTFGELRFETKLKLVTETKPEFIPIKYSPYANKNNKAKTNIADFGDELSSVLIVENLGETPAHDLSVTIMIPNVCIEHDCIR